MSSELSARARPAQVVFYNDPKFRSIAYQLVLCAIVAFLVYGAASNAIDNLARSHIASGFGFWNSTAGFDISQTLIEYSPRGSTYGRAFWVGLLNTLLVAGLGIVFATILGFIVGISRLSRNWLLAKVAGGYVETIRNLPLLLQLLFWYNAVLKALPDLRESIAIPGGAFLNNRGFFLPLPVSKSGFGAVEIALLAGIVAAIAFYVWARKRQERTGQQAPVLWVTLALLIGLPLAVFVLTGFPLGFEFPQAGIRAGPRRSDLAARPLHALAAHVPPPRAARVRRANPRGMHRQSTRLKHAGPGAGPAQRPGICRGGPGFRREDFEAAGRFRRTLAFRLSKSSRPPSTRTGNPDARRPILKTTRPVRE